ncbi:MAG: ThuA domain-containing protein [Chitinophagaceae bacterium]
MKQLIACYLIPVCFCLAVYTGASAQQSPKIFRAVAFIKGEHDEAHISFMKEGNAWFRRQAELFSFVYDTTTNWDNLNDSFLAKYDVVLFPDARPEKETQRLAFRHYIEAGGGWMGFHFAAFALTPSDFPQDWDWYHREFLGSGSYVSNTWRPTAAVLKIEDRNPFGPDSLPSRISSAPNEWYRWELDLRKNKSIRILASIDTSSFPLGTGPKKWEIWTSGYYPVVWRNTKYNMIYFNMGHNDIDYEGGTNKTLSYTFANEAQSRLILQALLSIGQKGAGRHSGH